MERKKNPKASFVCWFPFFRLPMCVCLCCFSSPFYFFFPFIFFLVKLYRNLHKNARKFILICVERFYLFFSDSPRVYLFQGLKLQHFFLFSTSLYHFGLAVCLLHFIPSVFCASFALGAWRTKSETFKRVLLKVTYCTRPWLICRLPPPTYIHMYLPQKRHSSSSHWITLLP